MRHVIGIAAASLLLASCQPAQRPDSTLHGAVVPDTLAIQTGLIHGRAIYLERMMLAPGATLEVQLVDDPADAKHTATIASSRFTGLQGPPYAFALPYDAARIEPGMHYGLRATLRDAQGHLQFVTDKRVAVVPGSASIVEFRLVRADAR
ncbi:MAG: YbaY family lipoprotein [Dokdonella sp.]